MSEEAAPVPEEAPAPAPVRRKPLTPAQWQEIRTRAELGTSRVSELAREFGISGSAVGQHLRDNGIRFGAKAASVAAAVTAATASAIASTVASTVAPFAEKRVERLEETREFYYTANKNIDTIIMMKIAEVVKGKGKYSDLGSDFKALNFAKRSLMLGRAERFRVLDADNHIDVSALPDLIIRDLSGDEIAKIQQGDDPLEAMEEAIAAAAAGEDDDG